jgi:hypothetical protein
VVSTLKDEAFLGAWVAYSVGSAKCLFSRHAGFRCMSKEIFRMFHAQRFFALIVGLTALLENESLKKRLKELFEYLF